MLLKDILTILKQLLAHRWFNCFEVSNVMESLCSWNSFLLGVYERENSIRDEGVLLKLIDCRIRLALPSTHV